MLGLLGRRKKPLAAQFYWLCENYHYFADKFILFGVNLLLGSKNQIASLTNIFLIKII